MKLELPANFPKTLEKVAFATDREVAWEQGDCLSAIDWLAKNNYAVLGFELWLPENGGIRTAINTKAGPAVYMCSSDRMKGETWEDYVQRSARETVGHIGGFSWPEDALEPPRPAYFHLAWADRESLRTLEENGKHTLDK